MRTMEMVERCGYYCRIVNVGVRSASVDGQSFQRKNVKLIAFAHKPWTSMQRVIAIRILNDKTGGGYELNLPSVHIHIVHTEQTYMEPFFVCVWP